MSNITLKKLNYFRTLAITKSKRKKNKTTAANTPKKNKKKTLRDRINAAPLNLFNRKQGSVKLCRNIFCARETKDGYYCSITCRKRFFKHYEENYMWANVRYKIFKRDKFTCKICKKFRPISDLQCDHIKPISLMKEYGYKTLNLKAFDEYIYAEKNLRTLCKSCHAKVTNKYMRNKEKIRDKLNNLD